MGSFPSLGHAHAQKSKAMKRAQKYTYLKQADMPSATKPFIHHTSTHTQKTYYVLQSRKSHAMLTAHGHMPACEYGRYGLCWDGIWNDHWPRQDVESPGARKVGS